MARSTNNRRPRVRKSAPTIRERQKAAQIKAEAPSKRRVQRLVSGTAAPIKKLNLGNRSAVRAAKRPLGLVRRTLSWLAPKYIVKSWKELRQVHWPGRLETWRLTLAVFIFAVIFGALVAGVDKSLDEIFKKVILK